jgi:hypothetical protein
MPPNKLQEVVDSIKNHLFPEKEKPYRAGKILWIIRQYLKYAMLAVIHGYDIGPGRNGRFRLVYKYWVYVPWNLRKKFMFSAKAYGYEFKLIFDSKMMQKYDYYFNPESKLKKKIRELIETDSIYELIPKQ